MKTFLLNSRKSNISACTTECFDLSAQFFTPDWAEISNNQSRNLFTFYVWVYLFAIIILNKYSSNSLEVIIADKDGNHRGKICHMVWQRFPFAETLHPQHLEFFIWLIAFSDQYARFFRVFDLDLKCRSNFDYFFLRD